MDAQLHLLPPTEPPCDPAAGTPSARSSPASPTRPPGSATVPCWRLDDDARAVGRQGVARARQALRAARQAARDDASHAA